MENQYEPPFHQTNTMTNLVIEIADYAGHICSHENLSKHPDFRRENRILTIYSSLAIEQNTLSLEQVTDVINGRHIIGPPEDIREVQNAYQAYDHLNELDPYSVRDLLKAHKWMTAELVKESGTFRSGNVGVFAGDQMIHAGTPAKLVPDLIKELFIWMKNSGIHPLIKSCIFHYEFEFIHPFQDGNGRTGRLWHTLILSKCKPFFAWVPIENMIHEHQQEYYDALQQAYSSGESTVFVEFMLTMIRDILSEIVTVQNKDTATKTRYRNTAPQSTEDRILHLLEDDPEMSSNDIAELIGLSQRQILRIMSKLKGEGKLMHEGSRKKGRWICVPSR